MITAARLRLTAWYLAILGVIVGLLSFVMYRLIHQVQEADLHSNLHYRTHFLANLFAKESTTLGLEIMAVDALLLILAAFGSYLLATLTLRPIERMVDRQRRFAAAASHELRTPLTALRGNVEVTLMRSRSSHEYEAALRKTLTTAERLTELVQDLTLLARPIADAAVIHEQPLDLSEVARAAANDVQVLAGRKRHQLLVDLSCSLPVRGDSVKLRQVIVNLLDNAIAYTPAGGTISLTGRKDRSHAVLQLRDTGAGISPGNIPHLFEPFYQAKLSGTSRGHIGLGLALADWSVRAHGGRLEVKSEIGVGTSFTLSIPLSRPPGAAS